MDESPVNNDLAELKELDWAVRSLVMTLDTIASNPGSAWLWAGELTRARLALENANLKVQEKVRCQKS